MYTIHHTLEPRPHSQPKTHLSVNDSLLNRCATSLLGAMEFTLDSILVHCLPNYTTSGHGYTLANVSLGTSQ